eukprot:symbB.v1.2.019118.t1/scaffold1544.1/size112707/9
MAEVLTSPFGHRGSSGTFAAPAAADALPLPVFVASGVARSRVARDRGFDGPQYYPLSPRERRALSLSGTCGSVAEPSRWLHSPSSLEASYAGLDRQAALRRVGPTPPATPPAHRVGILHEVAQLPQGPAERDRYGGSYDLRKDPRTQAAMEAAMREEPLKPYGWQERIQLVEEEKKELLRRLEVSNQRNNELELEREGLKASLQRMEKLLGDLVDGSQSKATREWGVQSYASYHPYNGLASTPLRSTGSCSELGSRGSPLRFRGTSPPRHFSPKTQNFAAVLLKRYGHLLQESALSEPALRTQHWRPEIEVPFRGPETEESTSDGSPVSSNGSTHATDSMDGNQSS